MPKFAVQQREHLSLIDRLTHMMHRNAQNFTFIENLCWV